MYIIVQKVIDMRENEKVERWNKKVVREKVKVEKE